MKHFIYSFLKIKVKISLAGKDGDFFYLDQDLGSHTEFIQNFIKTNFPSLKINDYAAPGSSVNFFIYKPAENFVFVFFSPEKTIKFGQLLSFKTQLNEYGQILEVTLGDYFQPLIETPIDDISVQSIAPTVEEYIPNDQEILDISIDESSEVEEEIEQRPEFLEKELESEVELWRIPYFTRKLKKKDKFPVQDSMVLNFINNENTIEEICEKSEQTREFVDEVLKKYEKKGLIAIRFVEPELIESDVIIYPKLKEPVSLSIGFKDDEKLVLENCTGDLTINEIASKTSIDEMKVINILDKYEEKGLLQFKVDGTPDYYPKNLKKVNPMGVQLGLMSPQEFKIRQMCTGDVSLKTISKSLDINYDELLASLKRMEEKGDILLKIKKI